ncbi:MAG: hypothetical protein HY680_00375 [Chloroflexi bacterium]|nr:hypothetical protein [Chloroflexota bacterium]
MITRRELETVQARAHPGVKVLSVYLDVDAATGLWRDKVYTLSRRLDALGEALPPEERKAFLDERGQLDRFLSDYKSQAKGLIAFSSLPQGLWWTGEVKVALLNEVRYEPGPHLGPLASLLDDHQSYCVALVDNQRARLFVVSLGEIEEQKEVRSLVPRRHGQIEHSPKVERQHAVKVYQHLKVVAEAVEGLRRTTGFRRLVVGGAVEALAHFEEQLTPSLGRLVAGRFSAPMYASDQEVLGEAMKVAAEFERAKESQVVEELLTRAAKRDMAVVGADETLLALGRKEAHELVVAGGLQLKGYQCSRCGLIAGTAALNCPRCGGSMGEVTNVAAAAAAAAMAQGGRVEVVNGPAREALVKAGGLGALLAHRPQG